MTRLVMPVTHPSRDNATERVQEKAEESYCVDVSAQKFGPVSGVRFAL